MWFPAKLPQAHLDYGPWFVENIWGEQYPNSNSKSRFHAILEWATLLFYKSFCFFNKFILIQGPFYSVWLVSPAFRVFVLQIRRLYLWSQQPPDFLPLNPIFYVNCWFSKEQCNISLKEMSKWTWNTTLFIKLLFQILYNFIITTNINTISLHNVLFYLTHILYYYKYVGRLLFWYFRKHSSLCYQERIENYVKAVVRLIVSISQGYQQPAMFTLRFWIKCLHCGIVGVNNES